MKTHSPFHKNHGRPWVISGIGIFLTLGLTAQTKADDAASMSTNATANTAGSATTNPGASTGAKPTVATPATTAPVKPMRIPSTATVTTSGASPSDEPIGGLSIDDLLNVTVTSAEDKDQKLSDVASAMSVITSDEIERSGATNIPDLLRYVPGVEVGQANNGDVSVGIRGFGTIFSNKLLVLVDGRSIYDPIYGGGAIGPINE